MTFGEAILGKTPVAERFVGFLDVLGFSRVVKADFKAAVELYDRFLKSVGISRPTENLEISTRIISDSILLVSPRFRDVAIATNVMQFAALFSDCLLRGGIAYGQHVELAKDGDLFVVSEALVAAAEIERSVKKPCVALHSNVEPFIFPPRVNANSNFERLLLYYEDQWIVNPFNIAWGTSAASRVKGLRVQYPEFAEKYNWFLALYEAVRSNSPMVPNLGV